MNRRFWQAVAVVIALAAFPSALWACTMTVLTPEPTPDTGNHYTISWNSVPGAAKYTVIETHDDLEDFLKTNEQSVDGDTSAEFVHWVAQDTKFNYIIRAYSNADPYDPLCAGTAQVEVQGDTGVRDFAARAIVPVVGSAPGAYGAQFKTYVALHGDGAALHGKIVFHRAGQAVQDNDPSLTYDLTSDVRTLSWDDIVAAIGTSGIGSLDIIPTLGAFGARTLPVIEVRVYNDAPTGTFGASENVYYPGEVYRIDKITQTIHYADSRFRVNAGVRTLESRVRGVVSVYDSTGKLRSGSPRTITVADPGMYMGSTEAIFGVSMAPGDTIVVEWDGAAFPFHTITENRTNDPFVFVQGKPEVGGTNLAGFVR